MDMELNGVKYHYEWLTTYKEDRSTLVCLHGFTGTSQTFFPVFQEEKELNILAIDLLGHGQTDCYVHPYRYRMDCLCQDIVLLTERLGINYFSLLGYSMGARTALALACLFPQKVQQLILESGSPGLEDKLERVARQRSDEHLARFIMEHSIEDFVARWEKAPLFESQKRLTVEVQTKVKSERLSQSRFGLACSLWFMGTGVQPDFWQLLSNLKTPTLLIVGALDSKFQQIAKKMQEKQPSFLIELVKDAGHCIHLEKPQQFERLVHTFLITTNSMSTKRSNF